jgi:biopolymer transport protein ExbB
MSISRLFLAGGIVMWPLLGFSIVAIALIAERLVFWFRLNRCQPRVVREVLSHNAQYSTQTLQRLKQNADLPIARIFLAALELALESEAQAELPGLKRFTTVFDTIISLSPLLGLLGTVLGLIASFASLRLGDVGGGRTANVTVGISEALVSTATGLIVAIFTLLFANALRGFYLRQRAQIQEYGGRLELIYRRCYERGVANAITR